MFMDRVKNNQIAVLPTNNYESKDKLFKVEFWKLKVHHGNLVPRFSHRVNTSKTFPQIPFDLQ